MPMLKQVSWELLFYSDSIADGTNTTSLILEAVTFTVPGVADGEPRAFFYCAGVTVATFTLEQGIPKTMKNGRQSSTRKCL